MTEDGHVPKHRKPGPPVEEEPDPLCVFCRKRPHMEGHLLCTPCYYDL